MALPGNIRVLTSLSQTKERKNHANDHDQSNQIDNAVHQPSSRCFDVIKCLAKGKVPR